MSDETADAIEAMTAAFEEATGERPNLMILPGLTVHDSMPYEVGLGLIRQGWTEWDWKQRGEALAALSTTTEGSRPVDDDDTITSAKEVEEQLNDALGPLNRVTMVLGSIMAGYQRMGEPAPDILAGVATDALAVEHEVARLRGVMERFEL